MNGQRIHIRTQTDPSVALSLATDQAHNTGLAQPLMHLVNAIFAQLFRDDPAGAHLGKSDLGMGVEILEQRLKLCAAFGNDGQDVHGADLHFRLC